MLTSSNLSWRSGVPVGGLPGRAGENRSGEQPAALSGVPMKPKAFPHLLTGTKRSKPAEEITEHK